MISSLLLSFVVYFAYAEQIDTFARFNLNATGYIIKGPFYSIVRDMIPLQVGDSVMVVDPEHNRMMWDLGFGGVYVNTADAAYIYNNSVFTGCMIVPNWNYFKQVAGYRGATALSGSNKARATYTGEVDDIGACGHILALTVELNNGIPRTLRYDQEIHLPFGANEGSVCPVAQGEINYDMSTLDRNVANRARYFNLPADCATPTDYCAIAYPENNACGIPKAPFPPMKRK
jgi:hypothetical protein